MSLISWIGILSGHQSEEVRDDHSCDYCALTDSCPVLRELENDDSFRAYYRRAKDKSLILEGVRIDTEAINIEHFALMYITEAFDQITCTAREELNSVEWEKRYKLLNGEEHAK